MKNAFLFFFSLVYFGPLLAQESEKEVVTPCGTTEYLERLFDEHPEWRAIHEQSQNDFQDFYEDFKQNWSPDERSTYVIPVVFHVIHQGGFENISDAQIYDCMKQLNEDYSATNEDVSEAVSSFDAIVGNMNIEFRLAGKDINGNCTKGITRTFSTLTYGGDADVVADLVQSVHGSWPQNRYMNVFVMANLAGPAGFTVYPGGWYPVDGMYGGIYLLSNYVGSIGTSSEYKEHTLSHEAGHWLNLKHVWGGSNDPTLAENCSSDDGVSDTPNTVGWDWCSLSGTSCGSLDNVQNFMEYSYCSCMFTKGQVIRAQAALNSTVAGRNNLWTSSNLAATGVDGLLCAADFEADHTVMCTGSSVQFTDYSYHQVTSRVWTFEGGTPSSSTAENPIITYDTPGSYNVYLQVFNGTDEQSVTRWDYISVFEDMGVSVPYFEGFEGMTSLFDDNRFAVINSDAEDTWVLTPSYGHLSPQSAWMKNYGNDDGSKDALVSQTIDLSSVDSSETMIFSFDYTYNKRLAENKEYLKLYISKDCGETWVLRLILDSDELTETIDSGPYFPFYDEWWSSKAVTSVTPTYYVPNFMYKFEFSNGNGNNLFLDNIRLYPASMADLFEQSVHEVSIYPNPVNDVLTISGISGYGTIDVLDCTGRTVMHTPFSPQIETSAFASGIYTIVFSDANGIPTNVNKFVKE